MQSPVESVEDEDDENFLEACDLRKTWRMLCRFELLARCQLKQSVFKSASGLLFEKQSLKSRRKSLRGCSWAIEAPGRSDLALS